MSYTTPRVTPYLLYEDLGSAVTWLARAFGFQERLRHQAEDGHLLHAEMLVEGDGVVMMGQPPAGYLNPRRVGRHTQNVYVRIEGLDLHFDNAVRCGAEILEAPADRPYGDRRYGVMDPEGHRWYFAQTTGR